LAKPKPNQDQLFLLQPNFSHLIFYAFVTIPHQDCTKTITSLIHQFSTKAKKANPPNLAKPKPNQDQFLFQQTFHTSILMHLWQFRTKIAQKPQLHLFNNFATKAKKANRPNLAKPKPNQDQFLLQPNFSHLIFAAFVTIPNQDCTKTITSLIHQFR